MVARRTVFAEIDQTLLPQAFRGSKHFEAPKGNGALSYAKFYWRRVQPLLFRSRLVTFDRDFRRYEADGLSVLVLDELTHFPS